MSEPQIYKIERQTADDNYEVKELVERCEYDSVVAENKRLRETLNKISLGHEYSCGSNEGCHCTCRSGMAKKALGGESC